MPCTTCDANARLKNPAQFTPEEVEEARRVLDEANKNSPIYGKSLLDLYREAHTIPGDISQHVPKLKELASECLHVTDIGMRSNSTVALVAGQPEKLVRVAAVRDSHTTGLMTVEGLSENTKVVFEHGTTPTWNMSEDTDLLFIDTKHTANHIYLELSKYAGRVRRYIVRHDTEIFGNTGEDGTPGLRVGILQFLRENPEWSVIYDVPFNNGMMVLGRMDKDKQQLPSIGRQAFNFAKHVVREATHDVGLVPDEVFQARLDKCLLCIHRFNDRCGECGCYLDHNTLLNKPGKAAYADEECPLPEPNKQWTKYVVPE